MQVECSQKSSGTSLRCCPGAPKTFHVHAPWIPSGLVREFWVPKKSSRPPEVAYTRTMKVTQELQKSRIRILGRQNAERILPLR